MKWLTCTPRPFVGDERFFGRDSGLFSRALRAAGCECQAILPEPAQPDDIAEIKRVPYAQLENPAWWRAQEADAVLLYAWGLPRYTRIARAIRQAGLFLAEYLDHNGEMYTWLRWREGTRLMYADMLVHHGPALGRALFGLKFLYAHLIKPFSFSLGQGAHLKQCHLIALPLPHSVEMFSRMSWLYGASLPAKLQLISCPVGQEFCLGHQPREAGLIIAAGRWEDTFAKRPELLVASMRYVLTHDAAARFLICGTLTPQLAQMAQEFAGRVELPGNLPHSQMPAAYQRAQVSLCTSIAEGTHISSAEALCCGCSIVAEAKYGTEALQWYASQNSGRVGAVAPGQEAGEVLGRALLDELKAWREGQRDASAIAGTWQAQLYAVASAKKLIALAARAQVSP